MTQFNQPLRSEVILRVDVIEDENDPKPNAYFDYNTNIVRVYHGYLYGGASGGLYMAAPIPMEGLPSQIRENAQGTRNPISPMGQMGTANYQTASISGFVPATMMSNFPEASESPAVTVILDGMIVNGVPYHGPPFSVTAVPPEHVGRVLAAAGNINLEGITDQAAHQNEKGKNNAYLNFSGQNDSYNSGFRPNPLGSSTEEQLNSLERQMRKLNNNAGAGVYGWGVGSRNNNLSLQGTKPCDLPISSIKQNWGNSGFSNPIPAPPYGLQSANPWASQPNSAYDFNRAYPSHPWVRNAINNHATQQYAQDMATTKLDLTAAGISAPQTFDSPTLRQTKYYVDQLNALAEKAHERDQEAKRMVEARQEAENKHKNNPFNTSRLGGMTVDEYLKEQAEKRGAKIHKHQQTVDNTSLGSWANGHVAPAAKETVDRRAYVNEDDGNDIFGGNDRPAKLWDPPVDAAIWGFPGAAANTRDWKKDGDGSGQGGGSW